MLEPSSAVSLGNASQHYWW